MLELQLEEGCNGEVVCHRPCHHMRWHESLQFLRHVSSVAFVFPKPIVPNLSKSLHFCEKH
jgi:hypothetical protein